VIIECSAREELISNAREELLNQKTFRVFNPEKNLYCALAHSEVHLDKNMFNTI
jgi:hypothetical protein